MGPLLGLPTSELSTPPVQTGPGWGPTVHPRIKEALLRMLLHTPSLLTNLALPKIH